MKTRKEKKVEGFKTGAGGGIRTHEPLRDSRLRAAPLVDHAQDFNLAWQPPPVSIERPYTKTPTLTLPHNHTFIFSGETLFYQSLRTNPNAHAKNC